MVGIAVPTMVTSMATMKAEHMQAAVTTRRRRSLRARAWFSMKSFTRTPLTGNPSFGFRHDNNIKTMRHRICCLGYFAVLREERGIEKIRECVRSIEILPPITIALASWLPASRDRRDVINGDIIYSPCPAMIGKRRFLVPI
jgi:hypothetical protein